MNDSASGGLARAGGSSISAPLLKNKSHQSKEKGRRNFSYRPRTPISRPNSEKHACTHCLGTSLLPVLVVAPLHNELLRGGALRPRRTRKKAKHRGSTPDHSGQHSIFLQGSSYSFCFLLFGSFYHVRSLNRQPRPCCLKAVYHCYRITDRLGIRRGTLSLSSEFISWCGSFRLAASRQLYGYGTV